MGGRVLAADSTSMVYDKVKPSLRAWAAKSGFPLKQFFTIISSTFEQGDEPCKFVKLCGRNYSGNIQAVNTMDEDQKQCGSKDLENRAARIPYSVLSKLDKTTRLFNRIW